MPQIFRYVLLIGFCFAMHWVQAQSPLTQGAEVGTIAMKKVLNNAANLTSSSDFKDKLTIVDFFGTWCVPCIRALPRLTSLKKEFGSDVNVVLVSNETEAQLKKFLSNRKDFLFPIIVDEGDVWTSQFQPPSLPYTVVVKEGKTLAITEAEKLEPTIVKQWLQTTVANPPATGNKPNTPNRMAAGNRRSKNETVALSQAFLYAAKTGDSLASFLDRLKNYSYDQLKTQLVTDNEKKAFWLNLYNAFVQASLKKDPGQYRSRKEFFTAKNIAVAGEEMSLDDIEHGILRRSKIKWALGYLSKLFPSKWEKEFRVAKLDYRIHFALNCGAKSCPPIAFYNDENLDAQLELATKAYLSGEVEYDSIANLVKVPKLMSWFRRDFGGKKGAVTILKNQGIVPATAKPKVEFKPYDWKLYLDHYSTAAN